MPANRGISALMPFPTFQEICSGCCTDVTVCIRTRSGMIVIRPATWRPLLRASSWVTSATFLELCSCGVREHHLCSEALTALEHILVFSDKHMLRSSHGQQMPREVAGQLPPILLDTSNNFPWAGNPARTVRT